MSLEHHSFTFEVGDLITFQPDPVTAHRPQTIEVLKVEDVPFRAIEYNHVDHSGGVGHHQWVHTVEGIFSGLWFKPERALKTKEHLHGQ